MKQSESSEFDSRQMDIFEDDPEEYLYFNDDFKIEDLKYRRTCLACPEMYNVEDPEGNQVAHIRLRWGKLKCEIPDVTGTIVYSHEFEDDGLKGCFCTQNERDYFLKSIHDSIVEHYRGKYK